MPPAGETKYDVLKPKEADIPSLISIADKQRVFADENLSDDEKTLIYENYIDGENEKTSIIRMAKESGDNGEVRSFACAMFMMEVDSNDHPNIKKGMKGPLWSK